MTGAISPRPAQHTGDPETNQGPTHGTLDLSHLLDLTIGAILGAAPGLLKDALAALRERHAIRAQLAFLLRELHAPTRRDHARRSTPPAPPCESASFTDDHLATTSMNAQNAVFEALRAAEALAALTPAHYRSHNDTERHNAARRAHRAIMAARATLGPLPIPQRRAA